MTTLERPGPESVYSYALSENTPKKGIASDGGMNFADQLSGLSASDAGACVTEGAAADPAEKKFSWTSESFYTFDSSPRGYSVNKAALAKVREALRAEGINADKRTPTHEITDEQLEWLSSRYDLHYMSVCPVSEPEFGNFMLDLAYLNVFSLDEVENMWLFPPQTDKPQLVSVYYFGDPETGAGAGYVSQVSGDIISYEEWLEERQEQLIGDYIKAENPDLTDKEYSEMTAEYSARMKERMDILKYIFGYLADSYENTANSALLQITDASEKLKEDFGIRS